MKAVGVLGGMGPHATAAFFQTLLDITPANKDWDHLRVVIDDNPHIPSRTRNLLYGETSPFDGMLETCKKLERYPVDLIALPCNSAAIFIPLLQDHISIPILNIIEITARAVATNHPEIKRAAILGGYVTYKMQSYRPLLQRYGINVVEHNSVIQDEVERQIEHLKLGRADQTHHQAALKLVNCLKSEFRADGIIFACTEFGCLPELGAELPVIDSSLELARETLTLASARDL